MFYVYALNLWSSPSERRNVSGFTTEDLHFASSVSGNVATPANALGPVDGTYTTDTGNTSWTHRFRMEAVAGVPIAIDPIILRVRKSEDLGSDPTIDQIDVEQNGVVIHTETPNFSPTFAGDDLPITFDVSALDGTFNLIDVIITTSGAGTVLTRSVQLDAASWSVTHG